MTLHPDSDKQVVDYLAQKVKTFADQLYADHHPLPVELKDALAAVARDWGTEPPPPVETDGTTRGEDIPF